MKLSQEVFFSKAKMRFDLMVVLIKNARNPKQFIEEARKKDLERFDESIDFLVHMFYDCLAIDWKHKTGPFVEETS
jgi:hypothetical protein